MMIRRSTAVLAGSAVLLALALSPAAVWAQSNVPLPPQRPQGAQGAPAKPPLSLSPRSGPAARAVPPGRAESTAVVGGALSPQQAAAVDAVNAYFNSIQYLNGDFTQIGPDGSRTDGKFYISKPGKVRFQYARPSPIEIISDGTTVAIRNRTLATQDVYSLSQTPLRFLLKSNLDLARESGLIGVYSEPGLVSVTLEEKVAVVGKSRLVMVFAGSPLALTQWTITDAQGLDTTVSVSDLDSKTKPDERLFKIDLTRTL